MIDKLSMQFVTDQEGNKQAVLIPIQAWQHLQQEIRTLRESLRMKENLAHALAEMKEIRSGDLPKASLKSFLDAC